MLLGLGNKLFFQKKAQAEAVPQYIHVGGSFTTAGGVTVNRIARWNGTSFVALGSGMNNTVQALVFDSSGNLYAGGNFTTAGGATVNYVAKWDGINWTSLGSGMNSSVRALAIDSNDDLYAGGAFTTANGVSVNRIAKWNGTQWSGFGSGMNSLVYALAIDSNDTLYAGGFFTTANGVSANSVAKWNGTSWIALSDGLGSSGGISPVFTIKVNLNTNEYYASGLFTTSGVNSVVRLAKFNGSYWETFPDSSGVNNTAWDLFFEGSENVYVTGQFTNAGGIATADRIALWNGTAWSALSTGLAGTHGYTLAYGPYLGDP